ncbi:MAG: hypothetical protein JXB05_37910 [Myxococcaceae bacterium]|nr:hypothetical protein [Myxococcaceae bacterium]
MSHAPILTEGEPQEPSAGLSWAETPVPAAPAPPAEAPGERSSPLPGWERDLPSVLIDPAQITSHPSALPLRGAKTPPPETPLPVLLLIDQARSASGEERQELSRRINRWLDQMVREGGSRHVADWFHHLIESERLEGLADAAGHACHETAIQGLLAMGFPYALEVRPEDLERIKPRERRRRGRDKDVKGASAGVLAGGILTELVLNLLRAHPVRGPLTVEVGLSLLAMVALLLSTPRSPLRNMGLAVLLVVSLLSVSLGFFTGYAGMVAGLAGLVAVLLFALHRS